ncbi:MAG: response regulator, partial [bacterium]
TTKAVGKGTGLGLTTVYGIVEQQGGHIALSSQPDLGSTFQIYLPTIQKKETRPARAGKVMSPTGSETLLFVDDEEEIVTMAKKGLEQLGYRVHAQIDVRSAIELFRDQPEAYDLVVADQTMPGMTGDKLVGELRKIRPDIPVIICTGNAEIFSPQFVRERGINAVATKPYTPQNLGLLMRDVLDGLKCEDGGSG